MSMRKRTITPEGGTGHPSDSWIDLEDVAEVEITSEDPDHPIENALTGTDADGWRAAGPGPQTIRLIFGKPLDVRRIQLEFRGVEVERTQELVLRWSRAVAGESREIVRQQWNFSPGGSTSQTEDFTVELQAVATLELMITPDISGGDAAAILTRLRLA
jgi:hypothetical protein